MPICLSPQQVDNTWISCSHNTELPDLRNSVLADNLFQQIGIQVKNRKQVRDLINNLLEIIFGSPIH